MPSKLSRVSTTQVIALSVVACIILLFILGIVGRNFVGKISHNSKVIGKKQDAEKQLKANLKALPELQRSYDSLGDRRDILDKALPVDSHFPQLVASMEVLAAASNVAIFNVSPSGTTTPGAAASTPTTTTAPTTPTTVAAPATAASPQQFGFAVQVKGSYKDIMTFLNNLQLSARPIVVTNVQLSGNTGVISASCTMVTYFYNPPVLQDKTEVVN